MLSLRLMKKPGKLKPLSLRTVTGFSTDKYLACSQEECRECAGHHLYIIQRGDCMPKLSGSPNWRSSGVPQSRESALAQVLGYHAQRVWCARRTGMLVVLFSWCKRFRAGGHPSRAAPLPCQRAACGLRHCLWLQGLSTSTRQAGFEMMCLGP